ncbi:MAG: hypothetical protein OEY36_06580 [Gammaproteobacteria bacterium]|nr:hypothetical protein [Gammaproteobacteria bacterium]
MPLTYDQIQFIQDQLCNNEFASDQEIEDILLHEAHVPHFYIDELLGYRKIFLSDPLAILDYEQHAITVSYAGKPNAYNK